AFEHVESTVDGGRARGQVVRYGQPIERELPVGIGEVRDALAADGQSRQRSAEHAFDAAGDREAGDLQREVDFVAQGAHGARDGEGDGALRREGVRLDREGALEGRAGQDRRSEGGADVRGKPRDVEGHGVGGAAQPGEGDGEVDAGTAYHGGGRSAR